MANFDNKNVSPIFTFNNAQQYQQYLHSQRASEMVSPCVVGGIGNSNYIRSNSVGSSSVGSSSSSSVVLSPPSTPYSDDLYTQDNTNDNYDTEAENSYIRSNVAYANALKQQAKQQQQQQRYPTPHTFITQQATQQQVDEDEGREWENENDNEVPKLDKEMLIESVRIHHCIWNMNSKTYKNFEMKKIAWEKIYQTLNKKYEGM